MTGLATAGEIIGFVATGGGAVFAYLRFGPEREKTAAELWRQNAEAWENRVKALEEKVMQLTAENVVLRSVVSGADAIHALTELIKDQHREVLAAIRGKGEGD